MVAVPVLGPAERMQAVLDAGLARHLVAFLKHESTEVLMPVLRAVGNIVSGTHAHTEQIVTLGALPALRRLLSSDDPAIVRETCWAVSNIAAGTPNQVQAVIDCGMMSSVINIGVNGEYRAMKEACWVIANLCNTGERQQILYTAEIGGLIPLIRGLSMRESNSIDAFLQAVERILVTGQSTGSDFAQLVEEIPDGVGLIEHLEMSLEQSIARRASSIIQRFFTNDEATVRSDTMALDACGGAAPEPLTGSGADPQYPESVTVSSTLFSSGAQHQVAPFSF